MIHKERSSCAYFRGCHMLLPLDMKKTFDVVHIGLHMLKS